MKTYKLSRFEIWIGEWINLACALVNLVIVPFGYDVHWDLNYSFYLLKKEGQSVLTSFK